MKHVVKEKKDEEEAEFVEKTGCDIQQNGKNKRREEREREKERGRER